MLDMAHRIEQLSLPTCLNSSTSINTDIQRFLAIARFILNIQHLLYEVYARVDQVFRSMLHNQSHIEEDIESHSSSSSLHEMRRVSLVDYPSLCQFMTLQFVTLSEHMIQLRTILNLADHTNTNTSTNTSTNGDDDDGDDDDDNNNNEDDDTTSPPPPPPPHHHHPTITATSEALSLSSSSPPFLTWIQRLQTLEKTKLEKIAGYHVDLMRLALLRVHSNTSEEEEEEEENDDEDRGQSIHTFLKQHVTDTETFLNSIK